MQLVILFFGVAAATYVLLGGSAREVGRMLRLARVYGGNDARESAMVDGFSKRIAGPGAEFIAKLALRFSPKGSLDQTRRKLTAAGFSETTPTGYLAAKGLAAAAALVFGFLTVILTKNPLNALMIGGGGAFASMWMPDYYLSTQIKRRRDVVVSQLPDVLDLLTVSVEAGLGFDAAVLRVTDKMRGALVDELKIVLHEMRIGETRSQALRNMGERLDMPETTNFTRSIIQADQLGLSLGRILRVQAQDMRHKRQMAAEEKAMKAPVKMLLPTAIFIFPAMFIVILGPALMSLMSLFTGG